MPTKTCSTCRFWKSWDQPNAEWREGNCQRRAPIIDQHRVTFPTTGEYGWCGEWKLDPAHQQFEYMGDDGVERIATGLRAKELLRQIESLKRDRAFDVGWDFTRGYPTKEEQAKVDAAYAAKAEPLWDELRGLSKP